MRIHVLETTITCLAERPYSDVSVSAIAAEAGVSRGGMQYHFPTRLALLQGAVEHLHARRLQQFQADIMARPADVDLIGHIVDTHWRHLHERDFRAYQELVLAARSEPELATLLTTRYGAFLRAWHEIARETFGWDHTDPSVARAGNIAHYLLEGMAYGRMGGQLSAADTTDLIDYVKDVMRIAHSEARQS
ncbi:TetR/AcrR family transcriptional regulator [Sphingomonas oryzagri]|uniref:TetR/AcrR family transcriptional regulator n=1 Tax=Sphingomonas oryzagri TaxID=3042314 RepID=A0ABT6MWZ5_9SPHN|nr:TetR/AcrR family transcriptional regulator [Sphingomonas oryzagri]MDH7637337.1 TetR/AcrR family transcriptional regulator [Sphingomonas oryzagri]